MVLAGTFGIGLVVITLKSGLQPILLIDLVPIGIGVGCILWLGRPAYIKADSASVQFVPPMGASRTLPKDSVARIIRVFGSRGSTQLEFRNANNEKLLAVEQYFGREEVQRLAQYLGVSLTWGPDKRSFDTKISSATSEDDVRAAMAESGLDNAQIAEAMKHFKK
ncbi:MAG TPA: hypothetical protein VKE27_10855 [Candidatus Dormibacteraeota bacterium]|nr:hypothetical protein [Candidatus Dormibacteraeota bacterium]